MYKMKNLLISYISVESSKDCNLRDAIDEAIGLATREHSCVLLKHNNMSYMIDPDVLVNVVTDTQGEYSD